MLVSNSNLDFMTRVEPDMTSRCYFGKMNSILGSVVPLAMFQQRAFLDFVACRVCFMAATIFANTIFVEYHSTLDTCMYIKLLFAISDISIFVQNCSNPAMTTLDKN